MADNELHACCMGNLLTNRSVQQDAAEIAAEKEACGEAVVGRPDAHAVVGGHRSERVLSRAVPTLGREVQRLAQVLLQRLVPLCALYQLLELAHCTTNKHTRVSMTKTFPDVGFKYTLSTW